MWSNLIWNSGASIAMKLLKSSYWITCNLHSGYNVQWLYAEAQSGLGIEKTLSAIADYPYKNIQLVLSCSFHDSVTCCLKFFYLLFFDPFDSNSSVLQIRNQISSACESNGCQTWNRMPVINRTVLFDLVFIWGSQWFGAINADKNY